MLIDQPESGILSIMAAMRFPAGAAISLSGDWLAALGRAFAEHDDQALSAKRSQFVADADLADVRQSRQGDPEAYRRLVERHQGYVSRLLWRLSRDPAVHEELVQDVFVEAYMGLAGYRADAPFAHWLARIATRVTYRYWKETERHKKVHGLSPERWEQIISSHDGPATMGSADAASLLHDLLEQLPARDRLVLTLRYLEQCDVEETARRTGWSKTMVKVQTLRARHKLGGLLERKAEEFL